jgi:hypothetical protein
MSSTFCQVAKVSTTGGSMGLAEVITAPSLMAKFNLEAPTSVLIQQTSRMREYIGEWICGACKEARESDEFSSTCELILKSAGGDFEASFLDSVRLVKITMSPLPPALAGTGFAEMKEAADFLALGKDRRSSYLLMSHSVSGIPTHLLYSFEMLFHVPGPHHTLIGLLSLISSFRYLESRITASISK